MNRKVVKALANQLLYPTFYALLPNTPMSIQEMAVELAEAFKNVYPRGPYNIVGVSLGGALAIEIAKLLEEGGKNTLVYFVDAAPNTIQSALKNIGEGVVAETNILSRMLNINVSETISKLNSLPNWEERVKYALKSYPESAGQEELLHKSLTVLRDRLETVMQYKPSEQLISGKIYLLRLTGASKYDNCGLLKYCKQIHVIPGDHFSIIKNAQAAEIINEKVTIF